MKTNIGRWLRLALFSLTYTVVSALISGIAVQAQVVDDDPATDQRWVISEIYLGKSDYKGAFLELYNNDEHTALGWKDFVINLPFNIDLPPIFDLSTYKTHAYKTLPLDEGWAGWVAKKYLEVMYGDEVFHEIEDALDEQDSYSYQRCQTTYDDGTRVISNKFYYGKKTPGKPIDCDDKSVTPSRPEDLPQAGLCTKLKLNEIGSYLNDEEQFIELVNSGNDNVNLSNCYFSTSKAANATHQQLEDYELEPGGIYSFNISDTNLNPLTKSGGIAYLIDSDDETVVNYKRYSNAKRDTSTALDQDGQWQITYQPTPGDDNIIESYPPCPDGQHRDETTNHCRKYSTTGDDNQQIADNDDSTQNDSDNSKPCKEGYERNPETNRCRKIVTEEEAEPELTPCKAGYERNPATNRCRKIITDDSEAELTPCREGYVRNPATNRCIKQATDSASALTPCREGYVRNPATNRCIKATTEEKQLTPCKEGYERNPETNRCVKKKTIDNNDDEDADAKYPVTDAANSSDEANSTTSLLIVIGIIVVVSIGILLWQYRQELGRSWQRLSNRTKPSKTVKSKLTEKSPQDGANTEWLDKLTK